MSSIAEFRKQKDAFFARDPHSPLTPQQRETFTGLSYYPEDESLCFEVTIERFTGRDRSIVPMQTSTGTIVEYIRFGRFQFEVEGQPAELTVYVSPEGQDFFVPFMDATGGVETYSGGRYLELEPLAGDHFLADFNMAYNPYCAYNDRWTCPIPPKENRLSVPIRAGEKDFKK
ncbi:MAG: DUF1684 domain-containing protein [Anaerolineae bacterium]